ncbi:hypothetical protein [Streptomyces specialis]|uniref:hypothetical protein n=1 Tax=Streptomyces specialis TaxID=498367 RepID=UPI00073F1CB3|nr:hypothetical protein [Streptomyces specialis]
MFHEYDSVKARMETLRREADQERLAAEVRRARRDSAATNDGGRVRTVRDGEESPGGRTRGGRLRALRWGTGA